MSAGKGCGTADAMDYWQPGGCISARCSAVAGRPARAANGRASAQVPAPDGVPQRLLLLATIRRRRCRLAARALLQSWASSSQSTAFGVCFCLLWHCVYLNIVLFLTLFLQLEKNEAERLPNEDDWLALRLHSHESRKFLPICRWEWSTKLTYKSMQSNVICSFFNGQWRKNEATVDWLSQLQIINTEFVHLVLIQSSSECSSFDSVKPVLMQWCQMRFIVGSQPKF